MDSVLYIFNSYQVVSDCWIMPNSEFYLHVHKNIYLHITLKHFSLYRERKRRKRDPLLIAQVDRNNDSSLQIANLDTDDCQVLILFDEKCTPIRELVDILIENSAIIKDNPELKKCADLLSMSLLKVHLKHCQIMDGYKNSYLNLLACENLINQVVLWLHAPKEVYNK